MKKPNHTNNYYTTEQGRLLIFISDVLVFDRMMEEINIAQYLKEKLTRKAEDLDTIESIC